MDIFIIKNEYLNIRLFILNLKEVIVMSNHEIKALKDDPLTHLDSDLHKALARHENLSGCFSLFGPIQICYSVDGGSVKVCLKIAGVEITCAELDPNNPCATLEGSVICAKASIGLCLNGTCLEYKAKFCTRDFPCFGRSWDCSSADGTIICL